MLELCNNQTLETFGKANIIPRKIFSLADNFSLNLNQMHRIDNVYISGKERIFNLIRDIMNSKLSTDLSLRIHQLLKSVIDSREGSGLHSFLSVLHQFLFNLNELVIKMTRFKLSKVNVKPKGFVTVHVCTGFKNSLTGEVPLSKNFLWGLRFE